MLTEENFDRFDQFFSLPLAGLEMIDLLSDFRFSIDSSAALNHSQTVTLREEIFG
jgi:hypothetical protein